MKKRKLSVILGVCAASCAWNLSAQTTLTGDHIITGNLNIGTSGANGGLTVAGQAGNTATPGIMATGDGGVVFFGTAGTGTIPATGTGVRMMWYPKKAAFRAGFANGSNWDDNNVGERSAAFNYSKASGMYSSAFNAATAQGVLSFAIGEGSAVGGNSFAMGSVTTASGSYSISGGRFSTASNESAMSMGMFCSASGNASIAMNYFTTASGSYSSAFGESSIASGASSFAVGVKTTAASYNSFVVGRNNAVEGNATTWIETDPLFVVGNGTGSGTNPAIKNRNAFVIYKNGSIKMNKRQGDILMGEFGNPE